MSEPAEVRAIAPAKVNLQLEVLGRRDDGYHELSTVMAALELADRLAVRRTRSGGIALFVEGAQASGDIPTDSGNLVWRAARAVLDHAVRGGQASPDTGLELRLEKRIPSRAGLGGGSSDAAATVVALEKLLALPDDPPARRELLSGLGADCVFFHDVGSSGVARCEGVGERVTPIDGEAPSWEVLVFTPGVSCSTPEVFAALEGARRGFELPAIEAGELSSPALSARSRLATDLEPAALRAVPELASWRGLLDELGLEHLRLSGSGSSFFGLYPTAGEARGDLDRILARARKRGLAVRFQESTRVRPGGASARWAR